MISWIGLWVFVFSIAGLIATISDKENINKNKTVVFVFFILSVASGLAVVFR